jgi:hypothetical protein
MTHAHYEVRAADHRPGEHVARTGGSLEREFDYASGTLAREASLAEPGRTWQVRYRGVSQGAQDLLVAAWLDGEPVDVRTPAKRDEDVSR